MFSLSSSFFSLILSLSLHRSLSIFQNFLAFQLTIDADCDCVIVARARPSFTLAKRMHTHTHTRARKKKRKKNRISFDWTNYDRTNYWKVACEQFLCAKSNYEVFAWLFFLALYVCVFFLSIGLVCSFVCVQTELLSSAYIRSILLLFRFCSRLVFVPSSHFNSRLENAIKYANS